MGRQMNSAAFRASVAAAVLAVPSPPSLTEKAGLSDPLFGNSMELRRRAPDISLRLR